MLFEDETCYEGNFADAGVFSGQGCLMCANGDRLEGAFFGNYTDGMKFNGTIYKSRGGAGEGAGGGGGGLVRQVLKEKSIKLFTSIRCKHVFFFVGLSAEPRQDRALHGGPLPQVDGRLLPLPRPPVHPGLRGRRPLNALHRIGPPPPLGRRLGAVSHSHQPGKEQQRSKGAGDK